MVVDDDQDSRELMASILGDAGFACIEAPTGREALEVLAGAQPLVAAIVDLGLPDMPGARVIEAAAKHRPGLPIIQCSGSNIAAPAIEGCKVHVFPKPYNPEELSRFVARLVASGR